MRERKIPQRTCIGCTEKKGQKELIRFVDTNEGIQKDDLGKMNGRGCYLCSKIECMEKAEKRKAFQRAFKRNLDENEMESIRDALKKEVMEGET